MVVKEESFYSSWFLQGWCQQSPHACRDLSEMIVMVPVMNWRLLHQIHSILFICDGIFFPLPHGISFFLNMVCDATHLPASLGNTRWCFARWKLQSPTREQSAYPDPPGRSAWIFIVPGVFREGASHGHEHCSWEAQGEPKAPAWCSDLDGMSLLLGEITGGHNQMPC